MRTIKLPEILIFILVFLLYANTISHEYALDDKAMITHNEFTQQGFSGISDIIAYDSMAGMFGKESRELEGGRYRPLSIITFAIEQEFFGGNPHISHFFNILFYAISLILLYRVLLCLFVNYKAYYWYTSIPFLATVLFAAHPLHTEIVANIKGRDEILAFLFGIAALGSIIKYFDENKKTALFSAFIFMFLGAMSKEVTITFIAVIPFSIWFFRDYPFRRYIPAIIPLVAGAVTYLIIRQLVIGDQTAIEAGTLMNNPFLEADTDQRYATVFYTLGLYIKLLIFPHPLTWDYYPYHIPIMSWTDWQVIISLILYMIIGAVALLGIRKKSIYSFGIIVYLATLSITSNLFFNIGAFMSERFVYVSLLGFCIIVAYLLSQKLPSKINHKQKYRKVLLSVLIIILALYSVKTVSRNTVWKNSFTLFENDVRISVNSAKGNSSYASELYSRGEEAGKNNDTVTRNNLMRQAIPYFEKAIEVYPHYSEALIRLGNIYYIMYGDYKTMFEYYLLTLDKSPLNADVWNNTIGVLVHNVHEPEYEKWLWKEIIKRSPQKFDSYFYLGELYLMDNPPNADSAVHYLKIAKSINSQHFEMLRSLGIAYGHLSDFQSARNNLFAALQIQEDAEAYRYLGISYGMEGDDETALEYFEKALELDPENAFLHEVIRIARIRAGVTDF